MNRSFILSRRGLALPGFCLFLLSLLSVQAQTPVLEQIRDTGPRSTQFNIVIFSEGYTSAELTTKFPGDASALLSSGGPFASGLQ
jgi:hypothetical protein